MGLTIDASAITTISAAESTSGWTGPTLSQEDEIIKQGTYGLNSIVRNNGTQEYYNVTNQDYSNQHLRLWVSTGVYGKFNSSGLTGLRFFVDDGSNTAYWNIADKTTYQGGWINIVVDSANPDSGSATMTSIDDIGIEFGLTSSSKRVINTYVDYLRYGDGYVLYGTSWDFDDVVILDIASGYGITVLYEGVYFLYGDLQIGRSSEQTTFSENGSVLSFVDAPVASDLYGITIIGQSSSTFEFKGCVITSPVDKFYLDFDDTGITDLIFNGNTVQGASTSHFRANASQCEALANTFDGCGVIHPQGCKFEKNNISNTTTTGTDGSVYITDTASWTNLKDCTFSSYNGKYAIHIPASVTGTIAFNGLLFDGSGTDVYWAGTAGTLTINLSGGSDASSYSSGGGTVTFASSNTFTLTGLIDNTEVRIYTSDLATELYGIENSSGGSVIYNYSGTYSDVVVVINNVDYEPIRLIVDLGSTNSTIPIQQRFDRNYKNP